MPPLRYCSDIGAAARGSNQSMGVCLRKILAGIALLAAFAAPPAWAGDGRTGWSATLYGGIASNSRASDIVSGQGRIDGGLVGFVVDKDLLNLGWDIHLGAEAQVTQYFAGDAYSVGSLGLGLRFDRFPWNNTSLAIYSGPSYALDPPRVPDYKYGPSYRMRKFLNYIGIEFAVAIPHHEQHWDVVARIYHRSGVWGVYSINVDEGSVIGVGIRARF